MKQDYLFSLFCFRQYNRGKGVISHKHHMMTNMEQMEARKGKSTIRGPNHFSFEGACEDYEPAHKGAK